MVAATPASIKAALLAVLAPGGVPIAGLKAAYDRTQEIPYQGQTPVVFVRLPQARRTWMAAHAKRLDGTLEVTYLDRSPDQQQRALAAIEADMDANLLAIVAAIYANRTLGGVVAELGGTIDEAHNPDGPFVEYGGALWVGAQLMISVNGGKTSV